jgi:hypothetical protein
MPSVSKKQRDFMAAVAHNTAFAKKVGVPQSVGADFNAADKGKKFGKGGSTRADLQRVNERKTQHGDMQLFKEGGRIMATKNNGITKAKMGSVKTAAPSKDGVATKGKTKGTMIAMKGGKPLGMKTGGMCGGGMAKKK